MIPESGARASGSGPAVRSAQHKSGHKVGNPTGDNLGREGDYDADGIMDPTVIRITGGVLAWWIRLSSTGATRVVNFGTTATGQSTFAFRGADFTGDGRDELIVARVINATGVCNWFVGDAVTGAQLMQVAWGNFNTHFIINPADDTGDGKADLITWAAGEANVANQVWHIFDPVTGQRARSVCASASEIRCSSIWICRSEVIMTVTERTTSAFGGRVTRPSIAGQVWTEASSYNSGEPPTTLRSPPSSHSDIDQL